MNQEPDPEASGLVHLTRLHSIAKLTDECQSSSIDELSIRNNSIRTNSIRENSICDNSISLRNQSSFNNLQINQQSSFNNTSLDAISIETSVYESENDSTNSQQLNRQSNHNIIQHLIHNNSSSNLNGLLNGERLETSERTYRSKSVAKNFQRTRLESFSAIEKEDLLRQNQISTNIDQTNKWSFKNLRNEFKANNFEKLFDKYKTRIQHNFFVLLLLITIGFNSIALLFYVIYDQDFNVHPGIAIIRLFSMAAYIFMLILIFNSELYLIETSSRVFCSIMTLVLLFASEYSPAIYALLHPPSALLLQRVRPTYFLILVNHIFLPHPNSKYAFSCSGVLISFEIALTIYSRIESECNSFSIIWYTIADIIFHVACSLLGFFINTMLEVANRRAFLVYRSMVEGKFRLNNQLKQQDDLLNTCIPDHLTARVKEDLKQALFELSINQNLPCKPFNDLYIEKYNNVTILYADIVNSMGLAANLNPQELVCTLNELYRRFDQVTEFNKCLRIKLLGDCYYCVSGFTLESDGSHAENCVNTGLSMLG